MITGIVFALIGALGWALIRVRRQRKTRLAPQAN
jgi:flagellar biogenesis protein FliO